MKATEKEHVVYFEFFGKHMKTTVFAQNQAEAIQKVQQRLNILKVEIPNNHFNQVANMFDDFFKSFPKRPK